MQMHQVKTIMHWVVLENDWEQILFLVFLGCPIRKGTTCSMEVHIFNIFKEFGSS